MEIFLIKKSSTDLKLKKSEILFEDNHLIIINKKPGILVQGDITGDIPLLEIVKKIRGFETGKNVSILSNAPVCSKTQKFLTKNNIVIKSL